MRSAAALVFAFVFATAACDWRKFDDLKAKTPVAVISAPSNYSAASDFGSILLAVPPPADGSAAARFVVSATLATSVAVVSISASGSPNGVGVTGTAFDQLNNDPLVSIAEVPGARQVVLGSPASSGTFGDALMMELDKGTPVGPAYPTMTFKPGVNEAQYGVAVAAGNFGGGAAAEIVVLSGNTLHVYADGGQNADNVYISAGAADPCPIEFSTGLQDRDRVGRAVIVGPTGPGGRLQLLVGTPSPTGGGRVSVFDVDPARFDSDPSTSAVTCAGTLTSTEGRFGRSLALVDVDGTGGPDHLLVGAPPTRVYLYDFPLTAGQMPVDMETDPDMPAGGNFGGAVAAFDIDGVAGDEMFVGNSDATVDGKTTAGRVWIYAGAPLALVPTAKAPNPLEEHEPGAGHGYGAGVIGVSFCPGGGADGGAASCTRVPVIGSLSKVYVYFTVPKTDPRVN
jgi:hypothetical protein